MIENLTKENFWNEMQQKYPKAMKKFLDWIDKYKEENNWNKLFNSGLEVWRWNDVNNHSKGGERGESVAPKYHELPAAFQAGIFSEFLIDNYTEEGRARRTNIDFHTEFIQESIEELEEKLNG